MNDLRIPAAFWRGGSSKGVFFHARDLPEDRAAIDRILLAVLGSPDPNGRQLDGMGGGVSSLSKAVVISPSERDDADVDYLFAQVAVDRPVVDWGANCGNLSSVVGPFALAEGLVSASGSDAFVRIWQANTRKIIHSRFPVRDGVLAGEGDLAIAGVAGTGARIALDFPEPGGTVTPALLPTGRTMDTVRLADGRAIEVSLVDATNPVVFLRARDLGFDGTEAPETIEADGAAMAGLDAIRRAAGVLMGLGPGPDAVGLANPKIAMLSAPAPFRSLDGASVAPDAFDIAVRMVSMERVHRAVTLTSAMCIAAAARIEGSIAAELLSPAAGAAEVRVGNPSGVLSVSADVERLPDGSWHATRATTFRTARCLMRGAVHVPASRLRGNAGV